MPQPASQWYDLARLHNRNGKNKEPRDMLRCYVTIQYVPRNMHAVLLWSRFGLAWLAGTRVAVYWFKCSGLLVMWRTFALQVMDLAVRARLRARLQTGQVAIQANCYVLLITYISVTNTSPVPPRLISLG